MKINDAITNSSSEVFIIREDPGEEILKYHESHKFQTDKLWAYKTPEEAMISGYDYCPSGDGGEILVEKVDDEYWITIDENFRETIR